MPSLGLRLSPRLLALAIACLPLCLWWGQGPVHSWLALLWHLVNPFSVGGPGCALKLFAGKFSLSLSLSLSLSPPLSPLWLFYSLCCYLTLAPSDCLQGIQALSLP